MMTNWHSYMWELDWEPISSFYEQELIMRTNIGLYFKNEIGFFKEPPSSFQSMNLGFRVPK
jgi:hypothetical protein